MLEVLGIFGGFWAIFFFYAQTIPNRCDRQGATTVAAILPVLALLLCGVIFAKRSCDAEDKAEEAAELEISNQLEEDCAECCRLSFPPKLAKRDYTLCRQNCETGWKMFGKPHPYTKDICLDYTPAAYIRVLQQELETNKTIINKIFEATMCTEQP